MKIKPVVNSKIFNAQYKNATSFCTHYMSQTQGKCDSISFCSTKKSKNSIDKMSLEEKFDFLKRHGATQEEIDYLANESNEYLSRLIYFIKNGDDLFGASVLADLELDSFEKMQDLIENEQADTWGILSVINLSKRTFEKAKLLISKGLSNSTSSDIAKLEDKRYTKALKLHKAKTKDKTALYGLSSLEGNDFQIAHLLLKMGVKDTDVISLCRNYSMEEINNIIFLIKKGVPSSDALNCEINKEAKERFQTLQKKYDIQTSAILSNIKLKKYLKDEKHTDTIAKIIKPIIKNFKKSSEFSKYLNEFIKENAKNPDELEQLEKYISLIDFKKLKEIAPRLNMYSTEQALTFLDWHIKNQTKEFNSKSLNIENLTETLENHRLTSQELNSLLISHPIARREVGQIPPTWLDRTNDKTQAQKSIYKAIKNFQKERNTKTLEKDLQEILKKDTEIERLGKGEFGTAYKIAIEDCEPACLKIFHSNIDNYKSIFHGQNIEIQTGLFLNKHSNDYVKMLFGKVATKYTRDGFLVTQFLDKNSTPTINEIKSDYLITYKDDRTDNEINGIIVDYGSVVINPI